LAYSPHLLFSGRIIQGHPVDNNLTVPICCPPVENILSVPICLIDICENLVLQYGEKNKGEYFDMKSKSNKNIWWQSVNLVMVLAMIIFNGLANALPLNGLTTGEISDRFQVYFVPAGYVFSIWGLIYTGLCVFAIYQILPGQRANRRVQKIGYLFAGSCLANMLWLVCWHYEYFILTVVVMLVLLLLLIFIYLRLDIGRATISRVERWCVDIPFSVYLGWITVATISNITIVLDYLGWSGWGLAPEIWTLIMLLAGVGIASAVYLTRSDIAFVLVIIWAYIGIAVKHTGIAIIATGAWTAIVCLVLLPVIAALLIKKCQSEHKIVE